AAEVQGGDGIDQGQFVFQGAAVTFSIADNLAGVVTVNGTKISGIEQLVNFTAGRFDDHITGGAYADMVDGLDGNDVLFGEGGDDILSGGADNDLVSGGAGADTLRGGVGHDTLIGGLGDVLIDGGEGVDIGMLDFSAATDRIVFSAATNGTGSANVLGTTISGIERIDFKGGSGNDFISGGAGADTIDGGAGDDALIGYGNVDVLIGGAGNDLISTGDGAAEVQGGDGIDQGQFVFQGAAVTFSIADNLAGVVTVNGTKISGIEQLVNFTAGRFDDHITGGAYADMVDGLDGND
ncbi:calcium-binding protein, partial [Sphingomonas parva]